MRNMICRFAIALSLLSAFPIAATADQPLGCISEAQAYGAAPSLTGYGALANCMRIDAVPVIQWQQSDSSLAPEAPLRFQSAPKPGPISPNFDKQIKELMLPSQSFGQ